MKYYKTKKLSTYTLPMCVILDFYLYPDNPPVLPGLPVDKLEQLYLSDFIYELF